MGSRLSRGTARSRNDHPNSYSAWRPARRSVRRAATSPLAGGLPDGMARRPPGYRLRWPAGVTLWEPHRPALTALKEELLASAGPPARERRVVGGDLAAEG